jgi:ATP-dependent DNA helicase RecG
MVDTVGGGIRKMFNNQRVKFFPLPEYDLSDQKVKVSIIGKILDLDYAKLLAKNLNLGIEEIILLDKIQKKKKLTPHQIKFLKLKNLIEGRKPNFYFSQEVAQKTAQKSDYTRNRAFENKYYSDLTMGSIKQHSSMTRNEINQLLWEKLPEWMNDEQRTFKINNLIAKLSRTKKIINTGTTRNSQWKLTNSTFDQG